MRKKKKKKKCFSHHWVVGWGFVFLFFCLFFFFVFSSSGNTSFAGLSNSVLVGCFQVLTLHGLWDIKLSTYRCALVFVWFPVLIRTPPPRVPPHPRERAQQFKQLCNKEMGSDVRTEGGEETLALLLCSVRAHPQAYQTRRLQETVLADNRLVEYKLSRNSLPRWLLNKYKHEEDERDL